MDPFSKHDTEQFVAGIDLTAVNRRLANYWLSLWPGDQLPPRAAFNPAKLKSRLSNVMLFDVVPQKSVTVRLAGTSIVRALRMELKGRDWLAVAPPSFQPERLRIFTALARGAFVLGHRRVPLAHGGHYLVEEILMPFAPEPDGVTTVLCHVHGSPGPHEQIEPVSDAIARPLDTSIFPLPVTKRAA